MFDLSKVQLKKVDQKDKKDRSGISSASTGGEIDIASWYAANIENWYNDVKDYTFPSLFLPLSISEANAFCEIFAKNESTNLNSDNKNNKIFNEIAEKIDKGIKSFENKAAFVKLSCRSPKDATVTSPEMQKIYKNLINQIDREVTGDNLLNLKVVALFQSHLEALQMVSGKQALELLLRSQRIYEDLKLGIKKYEQDIKNKETTFDIQIIVRQWVTVPISGEFRGFVYAKELTALSQYFDSCYFPELIKNESKILSRIQEFFTKIKASIPLSNYIIDFALTSENIYIIELNPFAPTTDACLFTWTQDEDILHGKAPFNYRYVQEPKKHLKKLVFPVWQPFLES